MYQLRSLILAPILLAMAPQAWATPAVELEIVAEREVTREADDGTEITERVPAENIESGQRLFYTIRYENTGTSAATGVNIDNPIPADTRYISGSAWGDGVAIRYSVDGGETFKEPANLTWESVGNEGETRSGRINPETYNAVRWMVEEIPAGAEGQVGFEVVVE